MLFKNVSFGIYYPGTSLLHRLQARTKLLVLLMCLVALVIDQVFFKGNFVPYLMALLLVMCGVTVSGISFGEIGRRMWLLTLIVLSGALLALFVPAGVTYARGTVLTTLPILLFTPTLLRGVVLVLMGLVVCYLLLTRLPLAALRNPRFRRVLIRVWVAIIRLGVFLGIAVLFAYLAQPAYPTPRLAYIVTQDTFWTSSIFFLLFLVLYPCSLLLTMTTSPIALIEGLTLLMTPLRWLRLPVDDFALMTLIALRFIPTLFEEIEQLIKAQSARGASFTTGSPRDRVRGILSLLVIFLRTTLRRASDLSIALEARGYQVDGRQTRLYEKSFASIDYLVLGVVGGLLVIAFFI